MSDQRPNSGFSAESRHIETTLEATARRTMDVASEIALAANGRNAAAMDRAESLVAAVEEVARRASPGASLARMLEVEASSWRSEESSLGDRLDEGRRALRSREEAIRGPLAAMLTTCERLREDPAGLRTCADRTVRLKRQIEEALMKEQRRLREATEIAAATEAILRSIG